VSVTTFFVYRLVRYEHDVQDAINILWTAYSCLGISIEFSLPDMIIILLFQVTCFKESFFFFIKVQINCQSLTN
jgi:type IV secretory pathway TrbL component